MSTVSTVAGYGGRIGPPESNIKQFIIGAGGATWIYKTLPDGKVVQTPSNSNVPVLISNDLIVTGSIFNPSDIRLKDNITEISTAKLDDLFTLNTVVFNYKNNKKKLHYGVLAQDVEKVFPELVEKNISGYKTVNYQELIPLMLAKLKNMQEQIDELKKNLKENI